MSFSLAILAKEPGKHHGVCRIVRSTKQDPALTRLVKRYPKWHEIARYEIEKNDQTKFTDFYTQFKGRVREGKRMVYDFKAENFVKIISNYLGAACYTMHKSVYYGSEMHSLREQVTSKRDANLLRLLDQIRSPDVDSFLANGCAVVIGLGLAFKMLGAVDRYITN
jgi:uncharacterized protein (DUF2164 family)